MIKFTLILCSVFFLNCNLALEYNRQRASSNTDFLLHEAGAVTNGAKWGSPSTGQNQNKATYDAQFPALGSSGSYSSQFPALGSSNNYGSQFPALGTTATPKPISTTTGSKPPQSSSSNGKRDYVAPPSSSSNGKRDYVAPPSSTSNGNNGHVAPQSSTSNGKRDYVAPPSSASNGNHGHVMPQSPTPNGNKNHGAPQSSTSNGKRDYVAPQWPALKPVQPNQPNPNNQPTQNNQPSGGKVKDLINFYDGKNPNQGQSSYSSIAQGGANKNGPSSSTTTATTRPPTQPTKPMSFSSIVSGNKPAVPHATQTVTTAKPASVLPSSIVNNNRGTTTSTSNTVTDADLQILSEELLRKDTNNAAKYVTINYQEKTTSQSKDDKAPRPLLTVSSEVWNIPTIQKFVPLLDNYDRDAMINEYVTPQERIEENNFMDAVMQTTVMRHLMTFLKNKGYVTPDPKQQRDFVKQMWFTLYSRGKGKIGSSGFEHVFVSELKNGGVSGLHNWIYFSKEEAANRINYLGYLKYHQLNDKGAVMKYHMNQQGVDKPVNSMFIGTSPELEMALYTLCFVTRVDNECRLKLANNDVTIQTYNFRYRSKNLIGSAFPQI